MLLRLIQSILLAAQFLFFYHASAAQSSMSSSGCPCVLRGSVVDSASGLPVPHALVKLTAPSPRATLTDSDGRFQFQSLPAGSVTLEAEKPGFLGKEGICFTSCGMVASVELGPNTPPAILKLLPEAVISGQVSDENGEPLEGFKVSVFFRVPQDKRLFEDQNQRHSAVTDDEGKFRIARLHPGSYFLHVSRKEAPVLSLSRKSIPIGYSPLFYPGVNDMSSAVPLKLLTGKTVQANFSLKREPYVQLSGALSGLSPLNQVSMFFVDSSITPLNSEISFDPATSSFRTKWVPPGSYTVTARSEGPGGLSVASLHINATASLSGLRLVLQPTAQVPVVIRGLPDGTSEDLQPVPLTPELVRHSDWGGPLRFYTSPPEANTENTAPSGDRQMLFTGVVPGTYELDFEAAPGSSFYAESATWGSTDMLRSDFVLDSSGSIPPIEVVVRDDGAVLTGVVSSRAFLSTVEVVLLSGNRKRPHMVSVMDDGRFEIAGLAPGVYRAFAVDRSAAVDYTDPAFLAQISSKIQEITLTPKQSASINLELATVEE